MSALPPLIPDSHDIVMIVTYKFTKYITFIPGKAVLTTKK